MHGERSSKYEITISQPQLQFHNLRTAANDISCIKIGQQMVGWLVFNGTFTSNRLYHAMSVWNK